MVLYGGKHLRHKPKRLHIRETKRRSIALLMALAMLCAMLPSATFALASGPPEHPCGHIHDETCEYAEGSPGTPCDHTHGKDCGFIEGSPCTDEHIHDESCGFAQASPCTYVHTHDEDCGYSGGSSCAYVHTHDETCGYSEDNPCSDTHTHDENCGYSEASPCSDSHTHDESCGYAEGSLCSYAHIHGDDCGYAEASPCSHICQDESCIYQEPVEAVPCTHICVITEFVDAPPPQTASVDTYEGAVGQTHGELSAALPETLKGTVLCSPGKVDVPVKWACADFDPEAAGVYRFTAVLDENVVRYAPVDNPETPNVDESDETDLPYIEVTTSAPEVIPTTESEPIPYDVYSITDDAGLVTVTGPMPDDSRLKVDPLTPEQLAAYGIDADTVVFAYDIKIMYGGVYNEETGAYDGEDEYQPTPENPVTVTIAPPPETPIVSDVEVVHIAEDATAMPVEGVTTTESGTVEFETSGFSVFIGTLKTPMAYPSTLFYNGSGFFSDEACSGETTQAVDGGGAPITTLPALLGLIDGDTTVYMKAAYTVSGEETIGNATYAVTLMRYSLYTSGSLITVANGGNLTLAKITVDGNNVATTAALVTVEAGGTLNVQTGAALQNNVLNAATSNGGGVYNFGGTLNMTGGTISGNTAKFGAGVWVGAGGSANLTGGEISENGGTATEAGGGVYGTGGDASGGTQIVLDGTAIRNNTAGANKSGGGGIYINTGATLAMHSGSVTGNTTLAGETDASGGGGIFIKSREGKTCFINGGTISGNRANVGAGVYIDSSTLTMTGGRIHDNEAVPITGVVAVGGGVNVVAGTGLTSTFNMSGGEISGNTADTGGGVSSSYAFNLSGGIISGNTATTYGGGVRSTGTFTMSDGEISGNTATTDGGGVYIYLGTFDFSGGTISGNEANGAGDLEGGGGVFTLGGTFTIEGGTISGNRANRGGGVFGYSGTFTMDGGTVTANEAAVNGGGVYNHSGPFVLNDGTITTNNATTNNGGGVFSSSSFVMNGGAVTDNSSINLGPAVYINAGSFSMSGGVISDNNLNDTRSIYNKYQCTITGGTIVGGVIQNHVDNNSVQIGTVQITGGSVENITGAVTSDGTTPVYLNTVTLVDGVAPATEPVEANAALTALTSTASYGIEDVQTDASGKLYLWLPEGASVTRADTEGHAFSGSITSASTSPSATFYVGDSAVYLNGAGGNDANGGTSAADAVKTLARAYELAGGGAAVIRICGTVQITEDTSLTSAGINGGSGKNVRFMRNNNLLIGALFNVTGTGSLTLQNIIIDGGAVWTGTIDDTLGRGTENSGLTANAALVMVEQGGALTLRDGAVLQNNACSGSGNGGGVQNAGTFTMNGGTVTGNAAGNNGGGVYNSGTFTMNGGAITGNTASGTGNGGGVYNSGATASFTMSGGTITGNNANFGGGVCNGSEYIGGTFTLSGGAVNNNNTANGGGGVYNYGTFTMTGGAVMGNTATTGYGGGVYNSGTFTIEGGTIIGNTVQQVPSGVSNAGTVTVTGGSVQSISGYPTNGSARVYLNTITLQNGAVAAGEAITQITHSGDYPYECNDVVSDSDGKLYFWLPANTTTTWVHADSVHYSGSITSLTNGTAAATFSASNAVFVDGSLPASGDGSSPETAYNSLSAALTAATSGTIVICGQTEISAECAVGETSNFTITGIYGGTDYRNTNNAQIKRASGYTGYLIENSGTLTLADVTVDGGAVWAGDHPYSISGNTASFSANDGISASSALIHNMAKGQLILQGGAVLQNNDNTATKGGAIYDESELSNKNRLVFLTGGVIRNNAASYSGTYNSDNGMGGGIYSLGTIYMHSGSIENNASHYHGGGVFVKGGGQGAKQLQLYGGSITGNASIETGIAHGGGGGVCIGGGTGGSLGKLEMTGGSITNNHANGNGGGLRIFASSHGARITGGTISGNTARATGSAIELNGRLWYSGGKISGHGSGDISCIHMDKKNGSASASGGSYLEIEDGAVVDIDGVIHLGLDSDGTQTEPIFVEGSFTVVTVSERIPVNIATTDVGTPVVRYPEGIEPGVGDAAMFRMTNVNRVLTPGSDDDSNALVLAEDNSIYLNGQGGNDNNNGRTPATAVQTLHKAYQLAAGNDAPTTIYICGEVTVADNITLTETSFDDGTNTVTLTADNPVEFIRCNDDDPANNYTGVLFFVASGGTLTLSDILFGGNRFYVPLADSMIYVDGGTLNMQTGAKLVNNYTKGYGGAVYVNNGAFTMTGGEISGNSVCRDEDATYGGGGVFVGYNGVFTMSGGRIYENTTVDDDCNGGGVYVENGEFIMSGGTISGNTTLKNGGGVYVNNSTFTMNSSGTISGNTANIGGGVCVGSNSVFTMSGGTISDNTAVNGGGVSTASGNTFTMSGGTISGNTATSGGGVYNTGTFTMRVGSTISGNTANGTANSQGGGGVYNRATFNMNGGAISGNTAERGGGLYNTNSLNMSETASISNNTALLHGGGVYSSGALTVSGDARITGNQVSPSTDTNAPHCGGGVYKLGTTAISITGGEISNNTADRGGGIYCEASPAFTLSGGIISENSAVGSAGTQGGGGGGLFLGACHFTMSAGTIYDNSAETNGSGIFVQNVANYSITLSASPSIFDHIYLQDSSKVINVDISDGDFAPTVPVPVTSAVTAPGTDIVEYGADTAPAADLAKFTMTDSALKLVKDSADDSVFKLAANTVRYVSGTGTGDGLTAADPCSLAEAYVGLADGGGTIYVVEQIDISAELTLSGTGDGTTTVTDGAVRILRYTGGSEAVPAYTGALFNVATDGDLTLQNITIDGGAVWTGDVNPTLGRGTTNSGTKSTAALIRVNSSGRLNILDGAVLQNNDNNAGGDNASGGILSYGAIIMSGGAIRNNKGGTGGGIRNNSTLSMSGGSIECNHASSTVGAISAGRITISGNAQIRNNYAGGSAGGISVVSVLTISGGVISGNKAENGYADGVRVYNDNGVLRLSGSPKIDDEVALHRDPHTNFNPGRIEVTGELTSSITVESYGFAAGDTLATYDNDVTPDLTDFTVSGFMTVVEGSSIKLAAAAASISFATLEAPATLTAVLKPDSVTAASYQWYRDDVAITGKTGLHYTTAVGDVGKEIHVVITDSDGNNYTSAPFTILPPQISVTVPTEAVVTVNGAGQCTVSEGAIINNSAVDVYVTEVSYAWNISGDRDADELFNNYALVTATLTLRGTPYLFGMGADQVLAHSPLEADGSIAAKNGETPGTLALPWAFTLGTGNYIKLAITASESVQVATITYTVSYAPPSP